MPGNKQVDRARTDHPGFLPVLLFFKLKFFDNLDRMEPVRRLFAYFLQIPLILFVNSGMEDMEHCRCTREAVLLVGDAA